jgi:hypothetical protein
MVGWCHHNLGWAAIAPGDDDGARIHFEQGLESAPPCGDVLSAHLLAALAPLVAATGDGARAGSLAEEAVMTARGFALRGILAMALTRAAESAILAGDHSRARMWTRELLILLRELGSRRWAADALEIAALLRQSAGDEEGAVRLFGACEALRGALGEPVGGIHLIAEKVRACRGSAERALGSEGFTHQEGLGRKMSIEGALSYALAPAGEGVAHLTSATPSE